MIKNSNHNRNTEKKELKDEVFKLLRPLAEPIYMLLEKSGKADILGTRENFERLNPAADPQKALRENGIRIISYALLVLMVTVVLTILCLFAREEPLTGDNGIKRGAVGEGSREYELDVSTQSGSDLQKITVVVSEQKCSAEELDSYFEEVYDGLVKAVLGANTSVQEVRENLKLVNEVPGTVVKVKFDDPDIRYIYSDGAIRFENIREPVVVTLTAELTYFDEVRYYSFPVRILPHEENTESFLEGVERLVYERDQATAGSEYLELPDKLDGKPLFWASRRDSTAGVVAIGGLITVLAMIPAMAADTRKRCRERELQMNRDYSDIISKLSLLLTAGMTCRGAWEKIVGDYQAQKENMSAKHTGKPKNGDCRFAYEEMARALSQMRMGRPEGAVYEEFGIRCGVITFQRMGSLLAKNLKRGSREITRLLEAEARDAFEERRQSVRQKGEEVGTKLLFPMFGMFGLVIAIVVVPAFSGMGM